MSLFERGVAAPAVSLKELLRGAANKFSGDTSVTLTDYVHHIISTGFPGIRNLPARTLSAAIDGYLNRVVEHDFAEQGRPVRRPTTLYSWMRAYAAASSTTASYNAILDAATPGDAEKPAKTTTITYRDVLSQLWLLDPVPGWLPIENHFTRLAIAPKHQLADPGLAARLLNIDATSLSPGGRDVSKLGALFESLATLDIRVYAQAAEATVSHLRTRDGDHEVDLILQPRGGGICALEVKLAASITDADVRHLHWLRKRLGTDLIEAAIITAGPYAYRREDGIGVIPLALLGP
jgi:predicted AAA+ superfamily ATPase